MPAKKKTYLENIIDAKIIHEEKQTTFIFQTERIGLKNDKEIEFLKNAREEMQRVIAMTDDEVRIEATIPKNDKSFNDLLLEDEKTRWIFAQQLVASVAKFAYPRLNLVVCPENIVVNPGMTPSFLHYGVSESLPPFERDEERVWRETKATIAAVMDHTHTFDDYMNYYETLELDSVASTIMSMETPENLLDYMSERLMQLNVNEKTNVQLPQKKWKLTKYLSIGLGVVLIPAIIYILYFLTSERPENKAYLASHEYYLGQKYSEVVTALSPYAVADMPYVVLFELAHSYVTNEALTEDQKENVLANISLQTDEDYLKYWIHIGRHNAEEAVELARHMEDGELITYGLLKYREEVKADDDLDGEEKQPLLDEIDREVDEYRDLMEEEAERQAEEETEKEEAEQEEETAQEETETERLEQSISETEKSDESVQNDQQQE